jgi:hypothetical protein
VLFSFTTVLATIHPVAHFSEECLSTLQFANRCRSVRNEPKVNHLAATAADKDKKLKKLTDELAALKARLQSAGGSSGDSSSSSNARVLDVLKQMGISGIEQLPGM